jgi:hypothetical protein
MNIHGKIQVVINIDRIILWSAGQAVFGHVFIPLDSDYDGTVPADSARHILRACTVPLALWEALAK